MNSTSVRGNATLLAVDDRQDNLFVLEQLVADGLPECELITATSAAEGLAIAARAPLDGALVDVQMPGMDGVEMCRRLKADAATRNVHVILVTAHEAGAELKTEGLNAGADDFINKPIDNAELVARISVMLRVKRAEDGLRRMNERLDGLVRERTGALRESEKRYRQLFATMLDGFALHEIICDENGRPVDYRFLEANPAFEEMTGLKARDIVGKRVLEVMPELEPFWMNTYGEVALTGRPARFEHYEHQLEKHFEVLAFSPEHGQFAAVLTDVTERRQAEQQLRRSQKMEAIGQLAGGIAHDFNNILTGITGYTEFALAQLGEDSQQASDLNEVLALGDRAADLTRQLLAFGRKQQLEPITVNINDLVENILKMLPRLIGEDIELRFSPGHDLGNVRADPGQIEQVLMNLAVNARDAMPDGGALTIETANVELDEAQAATFEGGKPGPYVFFSVADTGCGMDAATLERAFEPFFTTKEVGKGTGLGLATVFGIVRQHEGSIDVQTRPGQGARFGIYLPRVEDGVEGRRTGMPEEVPRKGSETILVVEDEGSVREVATRYLEAQGYTVLAAPSPQEAEQLFAQHRDEVALLLADVVLPGRNGRELYERLAESRPSLEVLYISGYAGDAIANRGVVAPDTAFVQKPFTQEELARKVGEALDTNAARGPTR